MFPRGDHVLQAHGRQSQEGPGAVEELREQHRAESERLLGMLGDVLSAVSGKATAPPEVDEAADGAARAEPVKATAERAGRCSRP
jgi:hypothetical protein